jgi:hypothetical protein
LKDDILGNWNVTSFSGLTEVGTGAGSKFQVTREVEEEALKEKMM